MKNLLLSLIFTLISMPAFAQQDEEMKWKRLSKTDSIELDKAWKSFNHALENKDLLTLKNLSLDKVKCDMLLDYEFKESQSKDFIIPIDIFLSQALKTYSGSQLAKAIKTRGYQPSINTIPNYRTQNLPANYGKDLIIYEVWIQTYKPNEWANGHEGQSHAFQFVKINGEFKFFGLTSIP